MVQQQIFKNKYGYKLYREIEKGYISGWKINSKKIKKSNIYVEKDYKIESLLKSERVEDEITIYKEIDDKVGESSFIINESDTEEKFDSELRDAIFISSQAKSEKFDLPNSEDSIVDDLHIDYEKFYSKEFEKDFNSANLNMLVAEKLDLIKKLIKESNDNEVEISMNSFELFNTLSENSLETSGKINKSYKKTTTYTEFVLTARDKSTGKDMEHIVYHDINDIHNFDFENFFRRNINYAKDSMKAQKAENFSGKVILKSTAIKDFWAPDLTINSIVAYAGARLKYQQISNYEIGKEIINTKYDKLNIYLNPLIDNNNASTPYDADGVSGRKLQIIRDNICENFFASKQFADYMGVNATGPMGSIEVRCGEKSIEELYSDNEEIVEIVSFASFVPDMASGDFSAEIRLGYYISNGIRTPFRGGLFSGNIFKILEEVEFSKETMNEKGYFGPKILKFHRGEIIGF